MSHCNSAPKIAKCLKNLIHQVTCFCEQGKKLEVRCLAPFLVPHAKSVTPSSLCFPLSLSSLLCSATREFQQELAEVFLSTTDFKTWETMKCLDWLMRHREAYLLTYAFPCVTFLLQPTPALRRQSHFFAIHNRSLSCPCWESLMAALFWVFTYMKLLTHLMSFPQATETRNKLFNSENICRKRH